MHSQSESCDTKHFKMKVDVRSLSGNLVNFKTKEQGRHTLITCGYALNSIITKCGVLFICSKVYQSRQIDKTMRLRTFLLIKTNNNMEEKITTTCLLRIEDEENGFMKDIKVQIPEDHLDSVSFDDIAYGASEKILSKYIENMKENTAKLYLLIPQTIEKDKFVSFMEQWDTRKAARDINDILGALTEEQRMLILNSLKQRHNI